MSKKIVLLNGPLGCGKDFLADHLIQKLGGVKQQFKEALYIHTAENWGIPLEVFKSWATDRELKEERNPRLKLEWIDWVKLCDYLGREEKGFFSPIVNLSPRDAMIYTSELIYKPKYGEDYFGRYTGDLIANSEEELHYVSDSGFREEASTLVSMFGADSVKLIRIHREGCKFSPQDSRNYVYLDDLNVASLDLDNNRDVEFVLEDIMEFIK